MGERVNGIHEVRGSIPLASIVAWARSSLVLQSEGPADKLWPSIPRE